VITTGVAPGTSCKTDSVLIIVDKDPYKNHDENFCFTNPATGAITVIFVGALVADVIATAVTSGAWTIVAHSAIGVVGGVSEVIAEKVTIWPG